MRESRAEKLERDVAHWREAYWRACAELNEERRRRAALRGQLTRLRSRFGLVAPLAR